MSYLEIPVSSVVASGFSVFEPVGVPLRPVFRYKATEGRGGGERRFPCLREKRPAAFRDLCQIGYSGLFSLVPSAFCPLCLPSCRIVKTSRSGSRKASNKREKIRTSKFRYYGNRTH